MIKIDIDQFAKRIQYTILSPNDFMQALRHRSYGASHNERMEFLGDSVLNLVITKALYHRFKKAPEGVLTRLRSGLVKGETLADIALELKINDFIQLGQGERKSGGLKRRSILADMVEAIIAAIYLESGFDAAEKAILTWYESRLTDLQWDSYDKDPKTKLQEYCQGHKMPLPLYEVTQVEGDPHDQTFTVSCTVQSLNLSSTGVGRSRRIAEQICAEKILEKITKDGK